MQFVMIEVPREPYSHQAVLVEEVEGHVADLAAGNNDLSSGIGNGFDLLLLQEKQKKNSISVIFFKISFHNFMRAGHRNLRTRRRMNLCMKDDQIGSKFTRLAPADMAM
jgi:hypothetical protein